MGNFASLVWKGVKMIGRAICRIVEWVCQFIESISEIVRNFMMLIREKIFAADDQKAVGKCAALKKEKIEIEKKEKELYNKLNDNDKKLIDNIDFDI